MKTILIFVIAMLIATFTYGQKQNLQEVEVTVPQFTGIKNAATQETVSPNFLIKNYLKDNLIYPEHALICGIQGTEDALFTVTSEGNVADFKIINSICAEIDKEIIAVLKSTDGMWNPGYNNGKPVDMPKEVSLVFCMEDQSAKSANEIFKEKATSYFSSGNKNLFVKHNANRALKHYSNGINYLPYDKALLLMRGMCRYELGDKEGALEDWNRMAILDDQVDMSEYFAQIEGMKGYDELMAIIRK
jgi:hypothetical protein